MWYLTRYLHPSCCSETHVRPRSFRSFYRLSTLDVNHVRKCTRLSPLYRTANDKKLGMGLGTRLDCPHKYSSRWPLCQSVMGGPSLMPRRPRVHDDIIVIAMMSSCALGGGYSSPEEVGHRIRHVNFLSCDKWTVIKLVQISLRIEDRFWGCSS